jgi:hypothetical protein
LAQRKALMSNLEITQLGKNPYALGIAARFVAQYQPFAALEFGPTIQSLMFQISEGTHLIASRDDIMVGYLGWLRVDAAVAQGWQSGTARLLAKADGDAIAVTLLASDYKEDMLPMIKAAKRMEPGKSVFWKRYYSDGRKPNPRRVLKDQP